jgi:uncharacterized protein with von Willebrand factor type A (vWA) domain
MFVSFFYDLRASSIVVTPTAFLRLQKALGLGLITSWDDFYSVARAILVKSERDFDAYDEVFVRFFTGVEKRSPDGIAIDDTVRGLLNEWLRDPAELAQALGLSEKQLLRMSGEELVQYFLDRLKDQKESHHGGRKWIGTGGTSPVGHSGFHPGGMRIGGFSRNRSAIKVALEHRYKDYSQTAPLSRSQIGEALKRLRRMVPAGPKDIVNVDKTISRTMDNAGEIEIVFDRRLTDKLKVLLLIDNGGWSMEPYVETVQTLFHYAQAQFRELSIRYFHNTVGDRVWIDPQRRSRPEAVEALLRRDSETRLIFVGDASMAPEELLALNGSIAIEYRQNEPSINRLNQLAKAFRHSAWLNPLSTSFWEISTTVSQIRQIFPMFPLNLAGLEKAVVHLIAR